MEQPETQQKLLNTVQLCFASHHRHEVVKAVYDAQEGTHDFYLISDILWQLLPEVCKQQTT